MTSSPLRPLRVAAGLTQQALADRAGVSQAHISELETGRHLPGAGVLLRLASTLGMRAEDLAESWPGL